MCQFFVQLITCLLIARFDQAEQCVLGHSGIARGNASAWRERTGARDWTKGEHFHF